MSTRALREALEMCRGLPLADVVMERCEAAQAELEAIERAARQVAAWAEVGTDDTLADIIITSHDAREGMAVFSRIAAQVDTPPE